MTAGGPPPEGAARPYPAWLSHLLVLGVYAVLTWVFWGVYVLERGAHAETGFIILSQQRPGWAGFIYPHDSSRPLMSLLFHAAYLLGDGSYLSLHIAYGACIFLTGLLTYLLVRAVVPVHAWMAFLAGAIALAHGGDLSMNLFSMKIGRAHV